MKKALLLSMFLGMFVLFACTSKPQIPSVTVKSVRAGEVITVAENFSFSRLPQEGEYIYINDSYLWPQVYKVRWIKSCTDFDTKTIQKYEIMADFMPEEKYSELYQ